LIHQHYSSLENTNFNVYILNQQKNTNGQNIRLSAMFKETRSTSVVDRNKFWRVRKR